MSELVGWRAIAEHLGISTRTAQRYERTLALPVQRGRYADEVHASRAELDRWLNETAASRAKESVQVVTPTSAFGPEACATQTDEQSGAAEVTAAATRHASRRVFHARDAAWAALVVVAGLGGVLLGGRSRAALPQAQPVVRSESPNSLIVGDRRGALVGRIAVDLNENGEWDAGEHFATEPGRACPNARTIAGVVVRWEGSSRGSSAPMNCNPEPYYHANLAPGRYRVTVSLPHGWTSTSATTADVEIQSSRDTHLWFSIAPRR